MIQSERRTELERWLLDVDDKTAGIPRTRILILNVSSAASNPRAGRYVQYLLYENG
jgi:hypothetical protein